MSSVSSNLGQLYYLPNTFLLIIKGDEWWHGLYKGMLIHVELSLAQ